ncbi:type II toxin-antitoxin system prevent-host-death family antitoxin [Marinospirillum sp.]|uniref:type II toxin-antitoxin system Phd/YefM family antitoxin n=1 Tax=Marinospirillum sp. TaxID=2183934 RepID=UPI0028702646|nr:type II toxin-antitoxin system prevent-host-death family antitoxin [Marinospirillum sp.]MDR9468544.1 type II toxin-antitoxin system prevent-host-death family antitoxin [Marinospirillum sp.]
METVNMHEAKIRLSQLVDKAAKGETFVIAKAGKPLARVSAIETPDVRQQKRVGFLVGQFRVPEDFDRFGQNDIAQIFEG